jgi:hypothetical protein
VATTWTTPGPENAEATATDVSSPTTGDGSSSTGGLSKTADPSKGAAAGNAVGNLLTFLQLGLWFLV